MKIQIPERCKKTYIRQFADRSYRTNELQLDKIFTDAEIEQILKNFPLGKYTSKIGLEIEAENLPILPDKFIELISPIWSIDMDGSLRNNGREFVLYRPVRIEQIPFSLRLLERSLYECKLYPEFTDRTATHIHIDFINNTLEEVLKFVVIYWVFEDIFFELSGRKTRKKSNFCIPLCDLDIDAVGWKRLFTFNKVPQFRAALSEEFRYSALNLCALFKYGTIELRILPGTMNIDLISEFCHYLNQIKKYAVENSLQFIVNEIKNIGVISQFEAYADKIFTERYSKRMKQLGNFFDLMEQGIADVKVFIHDLITKQTPKETVEFNNLI